MQYAKNSISEKHSRNTTISIKKTFSIYREQLSNKLSQQNKKPIEPNTKTTI